MTAPTRQKGGRSVTGLGFGSCPGEGAAGSKVGPATVCAKRIRVSFSLSVVSAAQSGVGWLQEAAAYPRHDNSSAVRRIKRKFVQRVGIVMVDMGRWAFFSGGSPRS